MKVRDVMTSPVVSVRPDASILEAGELMLRHDFSGRPVIEEGHLVGIVTERDFLRPGGRSPDYKRPRWLQTLVGQTAPGLAASPHRKVAEVMTTGPITVTEDTPIEKAVELMHTNLIHRLPVTRDSEVVGIVSRADRSSAPPLSREGIVAFPQMQADRHALHVEGFPQQVHEIARIRLRQGLGPRAEQNEGGWPCIGFSRSGA
jgi:CBS domain-containing protein